MPQERAHKISIIGAGIAGTSVAYCCMMQGLGRQIAMYDANRSKVEAQVLDLNHGLQYVPAAAIDGSDDMGICADSDVVVFTAGVRQKQGQSHAELAAANAEVCKSLVPQIAQVAPGAILLVLTSPVDVTTYLTWKLGGFQAKRVMGTGTVLDSARFRYLISERCRVAVRDVNAMIAGEHGGAEVPLWSSATIANVPLHQWAVAGHGKLTVRDRTEIFQNVKAAAQYVIAGKGATNYAIGLATAQILCAILNDENRILPVSSILTNYRGKGDVCLSVPSIVNRGGVEVSLPIPMNEAEELGLQSAAEIVQGLIKSVGF
jgi:L-lactate dehydrogenase